MTCTDYNSCHDNDPQATIKLSRRAVKFAKAYASAFMAGNVPAPSGGDCWCCLMVDKNGKAPMGGADHILSHIDDEYYVPSILNRSINNGCLSPMAKEYIARQWAGVPYPRSRILPRRLGIEQEQIFKAVRRFCFRELGLAT